MSKRRLIGIAAAVCAVVGVALFAAAALGGVGFPRPKGPPMPAGAAAQAGSAPSAPAASRAGVVANGSAASGASAQVASAHVVSGAVKGPVVKGPKGAAKQPTPPAPVVPKPSGPALADHVSVKAAVTFLSAKGLTAPQTYAATITPLGWQDKASGRLVARVTSANLTGAISAATGQPMGAPPANAPDLSRRLDSLTLVGATNPAIRSNLTHQQNYKVYLVLLPSGTGVVFVVDRLR